MNKIVEYTLKNSNGAKLRLTNYGATIISLDIPNKFDSLTNVVVGLDNLKDYQKDTYQSCGLYLGATIGRYAGRLSNNGFELSGKRYDLFTENNIHLHGGKDGFDKKYWELIDMQEGENPTISFAYRSAHFEEGYPGNLDVVLSYQLTEKNELHIKFNAKTDKATPINLTNHAYFNLNGNESIKNHTIQVNSSDYVEFNNQLLPSGKLLPIKGTNLDLSKNELIGKNDFKGIDNVFILGKTKEKASLYSKNTGILMRVYTNQPALVVYTPPKFPNLEFSNQEKFIDYPAICFEAESYPDAPNIPEFPSAILHPGEIYENHTTYAFDLMD